VVLYRLVTGRWPFEAQTLDELRTRLAAGGPTPLRSVRSELPASFVAAVERALERDPARRWHSAAELERELLAVL
jgi:serine/threonine protein kinase